MNEVGLRLKMFSSVKRSTDGHAANGSSGTTAVAGVGSNGHGQGLLITSALQQHQQQQQLGGGAAFSLGETTAAPGSVGGLNGFTMMVENAHNQQEEEGDRDKDRGQGETDTRIKVIPGMCFNGKSN